jgi:hypothetical protein
MLLFINVAIYNARLALRDLLWSGFSFRLWSFSHVRTAEVKCARAIKSVRSAAAETEPRTFKSNGESARDLPLSVERAKRILRKNGLYILSTNERSEKLPLKFP